MSRLRAICLAGVAAACLLAGPGAAIAAKGNVKFGGDTDQARKAKIVVDSQGRAIRGVWTVLTDCSGRFDDFRLQIRMRSPLDRSTQDGFKDVGAERDSDGEVSARYKHEIEGSYSGKHRIEGELSTKVVFRRDGEKYVTCTADVSFMVEELKAS